LLAVPLPRARTQTLDSIVVTDDGEGEGRPTNVLNQQGQVDHFAYSAWNLEVAFDVDEGKSVLTACDKFGIIITELLSIPIFDQSIEHIEIMREVDDAGWIAMRTMPAGFAAVRYYRQVVRSLRA
jgi:hypothetical protein